jgi:hypothetical protein
MSKNFKLQNTNPPLLQDPVSYPRLWVLQVEVYNTSFNFKGNEGMFQKI